MSKSPRLNVGSIQSIVQCGDVQNLSKSLSVQLLASTAIGSGAQLTMQTKASSFLVHWLSLYINIMENSGSFFFPHGTSMPSSLRRRKSFTCCLFRTIDPAFVADITSFDISQTANFGVKFTATFLTCVECWALYVQNYHLSWNYHVDVD